MQEIERLMCLERRIYQNKSIMRADGTLDLRDLPVDLPRPVFEELKQRAPEFFSRFFASTRSRQEYGSKVHGLLLSIQNHLGRTPPARASLRRLLADIVLGSVQALWDSQ